MAQEETTPEPERDANCDAIPTHPSGKRCVSPINGQDLTATMWKPGIKAGPGGPRKGIRARLRDYMEQVDGATGLERYEGFIKSLDKNARKGNGAAITGTIKLLDEEDIPTEIKVVIIDATKRSNESNV